MHLIAEAPVPIAEASLTQLLPRSYAQTGFRPDAPPDGLALPRMSVAETPVPLPKPVKGDDAVGIPSGRSSWPSWSSWPMCMRGE